MNTVSLFRAGLVASGLSLAFAGSVRAQAPSPAGTPHAANAKVSGKEYVLTHTSTFQAPPNGQRNPFWPIGWTPSAPVTAAVVQPQLDVRAEQFVVPSISVVDTSLAGLLGKTRAVGDRIPVSADNKEFVLVKKILDGQVVLDYRGHELRAMSGKPPLTR